MKALKTPLRYPGGKSMVASMLCDNIPRTVSEYREPFLGGGSVALEFTRRNPDIPVWVNDKYWYLYNFWVVLQENSEELSNVLAMYKDKYDTKESARELFNTCKENIDKQSEFQAAVYFWIMNKCSYSGLTENSSFSPQASVQNFTKRGITNLPRYSEMIQHWHITNTDYSHLLTEPGDEDTFIFLDPPYDIKDFLYGGKGGTMHKGFDHQIFADRCGACNHDWMITYNVNDNIKHMFRHFTQRPFSITYGMQHRANNKHKELMISNFQQLSVIEQLLNYES